MAILRSFVIVDYMLFFRKKYDFAQYFDFLWLFCAAGLSYSCFHFSFFCSIVTLPFLTFISKYSSSLITFLSISSPFAYLFIPLPLPPIMLDIITLLIILIAIALAFWLGHKWGTFRKEQQWLGELPAYRKDAIMKSRAVLGGHFTENLAPYLPDFPFIPTECRFIGKPIDFIVFKGADEKNINEVVFVEVKSGKSVLSKHEKNLKDTISKKKVKWCEYRIPDELTKKGDVEDKVKSFIDNEK